MASDKIYELEEKTYVFAKDCRLKIKKLKTTLSNIADGQQLLTSSGSVAANYIKANEKLSDKDFRFRLKISRHEAKESVLWLKLLIDLNPNDSDQMKQSNCVKCYLQLLTNPNLLGFGI